MLADTDPGTGPVNVYADHATPASFRSRDGLTVPQPGGSPGETHAATAISAAREVAMIAHTIVQALVQARLADLHDQARRDALARAARRACRAQRQHAPHRATALQAALTRARVPRRRPLSAPREG